MFGQNIGRHVDLSLTRMDRERTQQARDADRATPSDLENIYVRSQTTGLLIPMSNLVRITETADRTNSPAR